MPRGRGRRQEIPRLSRLQSGGASGNRITAAKAPTMIRITRSFLLVAALWGLPLGAVRAGEADDLQRLIDGAKKNANDLERLDDRRAAREDLTLIRVWLDHAWRLRSEQKYDEVRVVLDRSEAQAEMIRQKILAAKLKAEAAEKEAELKRVRDDIARTRQALNEANAQKAALQGRTGK